MTGKTKANPLTKLKWMYGPTGHRATLGGAAYTVSVDTIDRSFKGNWVAYHNRQPLDRAYSIYGAKRLCQQHADKT